MKKEDYPDAMFNMRASFYDQTKPNGVGHPRKKRKTEPRQVRKLRENVRLHQRPLSTEAGS